MALKAALSGQRVYLDSNVVIHLIEGHEEKKPQTDALNAAVRQGNCRLVTGEITLAETLRRPFELGRSDSVAAYQQFLSSPIITLIPTSRDVYVSAALYGAETGIKLLDAIHVASAIAARCSIFLTNDRRLRTPSSLRLLSF